MIQITPCRTLISDRFPVASFVVRVPSERCFEIVVTSDPQLLHPDHQHRRSPRNFYTTRMDGLLRAPAGQATFLMPAGQLTKFAGSRRLYYAMGSYGSPTGEDARFTVAPEHLQATPYIQLSPDFTGRTLNRPGVNGGVSDSGRYGGESRTRLAWGGDLALRAALAQTSLSDDYDDGFDSALWSEGQSDDSEVEGEAPEIAPDDDDDDGTALGGGADWAAFTTEDGGLGDDDDLDEDDDETRDDDLYGEGGYGFAIPDMEQAGAQLAYGAGRMAEPELEPPGFEDGAALSALAAFDAFETHEGEQPEIDDEPLGEVAGPPPPPTPPTAPTPPRTPAAGAIPLSIEEKFRIVLAVAPFESDTASYAKQTLNPDGEGLRWGLVQFDQRSGMLGRVLRAAHRRDAAQFAKVFGPAAAELLRVVTSPTPETRLQPVGGRHLWATDWPSKKPDEPSWPQRFDAAARSMAFKAAQNEVAIEGFLDPNLQFVKWMGLDTDRALAMVFDRAVDMGGDAARWWITESVGPIQNRTDRDRALRALGHANLGAFQKSIEGLKADGRWGPMTHAALIAALRALGERSPLRVRTRAEMMRQMAAAARSQGHRWAHRPSELATRSTGLQDTRYVLP